MTKTLTETRAAVAALLEDAERAAGTYSDDPQGYHARHRFEMERIGRQLKADFGMAINDRWDGASVRLAGIRSSSTTGLSGALRNWLRAADQRLAKEG